MLADIGNRLGGQVATGTVDGRRRASFAPEREEAHGKRGVIDTERNKRMCE